MSLLLQGRTPIRLCVWSLCMATLLSVFKREQAVATDPHENGKLVLNGQLNCKLNTGILHSTGYTVRYWIDLAGLE